MSRIDVETIRVWGLGWRSWIRLAVGMVCLIGGAVLIVVASTPGGYPPGRWIAGVGGALFAVMSPIGLMQAFRGLHPLELDGQELRIAAGVRTARIPLAEVSGVGLRFRWLSGSNGLPAGWYLAIWDAAGKAHQIEECWVSSHWTSADYRSASRPRETSEDLAATEAGRMARGIYDRVWAVQGSSGPLATRQEQKMRDTTKWSRDISTYAWWSPDGEIGELTWPAPAYDDDDW